MTPIQFFATYGPAARNVCHGTPLLASVCLAQAALESNWGESGLTKRAFNFFGFKVGSSWAGAVLSLPTNEQLIGGKVVTVQAHFRSYSSPGESFRDRNRLFLTLARYRPVLAAKDYASQAHQIRACGYATDLKYAEKLVAIIQAHNLTRFDA